MVCRMTLQRLSWGVFLWNAGPSSGVVLYEMNTHTFCLGGPVGSPVMVAIDYEDMGYRLPDGSIGLADCPFSKVTVTCSSPVVLRIRNARGKRAVFHEWDVTGGEFVLDVVGTRKIGDYVFAVGWVS